MSNISPRNCRLNFSVSLVFFMTEKSVLTKPGPVIASRLRLPGWQVVPVHAGEFYGLQLAGTRSAWPSKIKFASLMAGFT